MTIFLKTNYFFAILILISSLMIIGSGENNYPENNYPEEKTTKSKQQNNANCKNQESSLEYFEKSRFIDLGISTFYDGPNAQYLGDCVYEVGTNLFDWQLGGQFDLYIKYRYLPNSDDWEWISAESYKAINGQWVRQY